MLEDSYESGYQQVQTEIEQDNQIRQPARRSKAILPHQATQFQRTEHRQSVKDAYSDVKAEYLEGKGGSVKTLSSFGKALLSQEFIFDSNGDLTTISVEKRLKRGFLKTAVKQLTSGEIPLPPEMSIRLSRNQDGKFKVTQRNSTPDLKKWEEEFSNHVRMNARQPHSPPYSEYTEYGEPLARLVAQKQNTNELT